MFDDRKAKAGPASFAGPAFVDPVEAFEDALSLILRDPDAAVLHGEEGAGVLLSRPDQDGSVFPVVLDGILNQVFEQFLQEVPVRGQDRGSCPAGQRQTALFRTDRKISAAFLSQPFRS